MRSQAVLLALLGCLSGMAIADSCSKAQKELPAIFTALDREQAEQAEALLRPMIASQDGCSRVVLGHARLLALQQDFPNAEHAFERYTDVAPDDAAGYSYFARMLMDEGNETRAATLASIALEKNASDSTALAVTAQLLDAQGKTQSALDMLTRAGKLNPDDMQTQFQLGAIYDRLKRPLDAVPYFERVTSIEPWNASAWDYLALNLEPIGQIDGAESAYKKGLQVNREGPHFDSFLDYNYGRFLMKLDQLSASKTHLDKAVLLTPETRAVWYERAKLNLRLKDYPQARSDAEKAAALADPTGEIIDLQIYTLLEQIYRRLGLVDLAGKYAELGRDTPPPVRAER